VAADVRFAPEAATDIEAGFRWYEEQRPGLGSQFLDCVVVCLERLRRSPEMHERIKGEYRRALVRRFPYAIFYSYDGLTATVYSIMHTARDSAKWQGRLP